MSSGFVPVHYTLHQVMVLSSGIMFITGIYVVKILMCHQFLNTSSNKNLAPKMHKKIAFKLNGD